MRVVVPVVVLLAVTAVLAPGQALSAPTVQLPASPLSPTLAPPSPGDDNMPLTHAVLPAGFNGAATPILTADPARWFDVLREEGIASANRAASSTSDDKTDLLHGIFGLGDAQDDGHDDVVVVTYDGQDRTLQALDDAKEGRPIWSMTDREDLLIYGVGDVNEDGVEDFAKSTVTTEGETIHESVQVVSGADLAPLFDTVLDSKSETEVPSDTLSAILTANTRISVDIEGLADLFEDQPGLARFHLHLEVSSTTSSLSLLEQDYESHASLGIDLLGLDGQVAWSFDRQDWFLQDLEDANGDGVDDLLMATGLVTHERTGLLVTVDDVLAPVTGVGPAPGAAPSLAVVDGATGKIDWERTFEPDTILITRFIGDVYGSGQALAAVRGPLDFDAPEAALLLLDGATGETRETLPPTSALPLGDVDGDGRDEFAIVKGSSDEGMQLVARDADGEEVWELDLPTEADLGLVDLDGDEVIDIITSSANETSALDGRDLGARWHLSTQHHIGYGALKSIDSEKGADLYLSFVDGDEEDAANPVFVSLLSGLDGHLFWRKQVYDPSDYDDVATQDAYLSVDNSGDQTGDGADDVIIEYTSTPRVVVCIDDECDSEAPDGEPLSIETVVSGVDGKTILRYDDGPLEAEQESATEHKASIGPAGSDLQDKLSPGAGLLMVLAVLALAGLARRRA